MVGDWFGEVVREEEDNRAQLGKLGFPVVPPSVKRATISEVRERFRQSVGGGPSPTPCAPLPPGLMPSAAIRICRNRRNRGPR